MINPKNFLIIYSNKILRKLARLLFKIELKYNYQPIYGFYHTGNKHDKQALLSYRVLQVREQSRKTWSSGADIHDILRVLSDLGYKTDIIHSEDDSFEPKKSYDLLMAHGGKNLKKLFQSVPEKTIKIFYPNSAYWKFQNKEEQKRIDELEERKGKIVHPERLISESYEDYALENADGVILLSNDRGRKTYPNPQTILNLEGASFSEKKYLADLESKDYQSAKNGFLILSGSGNVHKGLDLLLEVFAKKPEKDLYICCKLEEDFKKTYDQELFKTANIHYIGHIALYQKQHFDLLNKCNYLIFPSASEGSPGSVADSMMQGLIPIVSRNSHMDVDGFGEYLDPCSIENISRVVDQISNHDVQWYKQKSLKSREEAMKRFSQKLFRNRLKQHISNIIDQKK